MHAGCVRFSLLNQTILLVTLDSTEGCRKASFASSPERFLRWEPQDGADSRGPGLPLQGGRQELTAQVQKIKEKPKISKTQMRSYLRRDIFTNCRFQNHFSYQNNPPTFPEDSASCSCGSPQEGVEVFQLFGKKINYSVKRLPGDLELVLNNPENLWSHLVSAARQFYKPS